MRKTASMAFAWFCFAALASAQIPTAGNLFAGYSYYNTSLGAQRQSLNGWEGSVEGKPFPVPFLGVVADFSANYGSAKFVNPAATCAIGVVCSPFGANTHVDNFLVGPRVSASIPPSPAGWAADWTTSCFAFSPGGCRETTSTRSCSTCRRITCACPPASWCTSDPEPNNKSRIQLVG